MGGKIKTDLTQRGKELFRKVSCGKPDAMEKEKLRQVATGWNIKNVKPVGWEERRSKLNVGSIQLAESVRLEFTRNRGTA